MDPYSHHPLPHHYNPHIPQSARSSIQVESFQFPSYSERVEVDSEPDVSIPIGESGRSSIGDGGGGDETDEEILEEAIKLAEFRQQSAGFNNQDLSNMYLQKYESIDRQNSQQQNSFNSGLSNRRVSNDYSFQTVSCNGVSSSDDDDHQSANPVMLHDRPRPKQSPPYQGTGATQPYELSTPVQVKPQQPPTKVFITYADIEGDREMKTTMGNLYSFLRNNGIEPKIDFMDDLIQTMSVAAWLEAQLEECDFVMVCITSDYAAVVEDRLPSSKHSGNVIHTTYVYRQIHQEFIENQAKNYRFLPVLVGDGKRNHVPRWLRDTRLYNWPADYKDLMYRILRVPKFKKPKLGPVPVCTVRTYNS